MPTEQLKNILFPSISIITVVYNSVKSIEPTIKSVLDQDYPNLEYIIIDGGSTDGTIQLVNNYEDKISLILSEPDNGIYDAMNKGILYSHGEWINFMNSGDCFNKSDVLTKIFSNKIDNNIRFIYSDYYVKKRDQKKLYNASYEKGVILHQSCIYKRDIHNDFGRYHVSKPIIISDYLFFNLIPKEYYFKTDVIISINDGNGITSGSWIITQKYCLDFVFKRIGLFQLFNSIISGYVKRGLFYMISIFIK